MGALPMVRFPGEIVQHPDFGELWLPTVEVALSSSRTERPMLVEMIADSGAFLTLIPLRVGARLGFSLGPDEKPRHGKGAGASAIPYVVRQVHMQIGKGWIFARIGWVQNDRTPPLLGRIDVFDAFSIEFRQSDRLTILRRRRKRQSKL